MIINQGGVYQGRGGVDDRARGIDGWELNRLKLQSLAATRH